MPLHVKRELHVKAIVAETGMEVKLLDIEDEIKTPSSQWIEENLLHEIPGTEGIYELELVFQDIEQGSYYPKEIKTEMHIEDYTKLYNWWEDERTFRGKEENNE